MEKAVEAPKGFSWAVPDSLQIPPDPLKCRLDFHHQACVMTLFDGDIVDTKIVSAMDVAYALSTELTFGTGLLPANTLWWTNTRNGPVYALYVEPKTWKVALLVDADKPPRRFVIPMPALIFLCTPSLAPWVFAVKKKPTKITDIVYRAPLCNLHENGRSCAGTHKYPKRVADVVNSFFTSFFTATADLTNRSLAYPYSVVGLWEHLDKKKRFPMSDLVKHGTVRDLMEMEI